MSPSAATRLSRGRASSKWISHTGAQETIYEEPDQRWFKTGALTGVLWHEGYLYFTNTDRLSRLRPDGIVQDVVTT